MKEHDRDAGGPRSNAAEEGPETGSRTPRAGESSRFSRRDVLSLAAAAGVVGLAAGAAPELFAPQAAFARTTLTPDQALKELMDGNARYLAGTFRSFDEDLSILKQKTAEKQEPFAAVLSCVDSRVPVELVFDQSIGHVLVARVAGNIASPAIIGSLEFGTQVLGARALVVLGHAACGAVAAAMNNTAVPGQISGLYPYIRPALGNAGADLVLEGAIKANAVLQARQLQQASPVIAGLVKDGKLLVVAAYYHVGTGKVSLLTS